MQLRDRLEEIKGKNVEIMNNFHADGFSIVKYTFYEGKKSADIIVAVGEDCIKLKNGDIRPFSAISIISGDI